MEMEKELNLENVCEEIRNIIADERELVSRIGVFGSLARGDFNEKSDIDVLIEYAAPSVLSVDHYDLFCGLCIKVREVLLDIFQRKIDVVHYNDDERNSIFNDEVAGDVKWI
jgi:predicted nucleotidyltransferase